MVARDGWLRIAPLAARKPAALPVWWTPLRMPSFWSMEPAPVAVNGGGEANVRDYSAVYTLARGFWSRRRGPEGKAAMGIVRGLHSPLASDLEGVINGMELAGASALEASEERLGRQAASLRRIYREDD